NPGTVGTLGHESTEKPPGDPHSCGSNWDVRTRGTRKGEPAESGKNRQVLSGTRVRGGREPAES
ncbi:hypothetical protein KI387_005496, partial [Taxus chinensis]